MIDVYYNMEEVPKHVQQQLKGLGNCRTHDNLRSIGFGLAVDDNRVVDTIVIESSQDDTVRAWGIVYWDDYACHDAQGIQVYTRVSDRVKGYGTLVYNELKEHLHDYTKEPIISVFKDNIRWWKKVGAVPKYVHHSMQRSRP